MKKNNTISSYCGIECSTCPIYLATIEKDPVEQSILRSEIAEECSKHYGKYYKPNDIGDCDGCKVKSGRLFGACANCEIRKCAIRKNIANCAYCHDYACDELLRLFALDPEAKNQLERIRKKIMLNNGN